MSTVTVRSPSTMKPAFAQLGSPVGSAVGNLLGVMVVECGMAALLQTGSVLRGVLGQEPGKPASSTTANSPPGASRS